jgi:calcineurin-like phosphoesterase family protein
MSNEKIFFTSDWHLNEQRIFDFNPFFRPFKSVKEQNETIINNCNALLSKGDHLYHLGDVGMDIEGIEMLDKIKCKKRTLVLGNYDTDDIEKMAILSKHFDYIVSEDNIKINNRPFYLNHYPTNAAKYLQGKDERMFGIVGHIHGLWKVQPTMINVGVDAWHFKPISQDTILFQANAIEHYYDENVFPYTYDKMKMKMKGQDV